MTFSDQQLEEYLREGISAMLRHWQVLKIATENDLVNKNGQKILKELQATQQGDSLSHLSQNELVNKFILDATEYILEYECTQADVEDFILDFIEDYFHVLIEDQSEKQIARMTLELFADLQEGKLDKLEKLRELETKLSQYSIPLVRKREEDPVDALAEGLEETRLEEKKPVIDEDGFMMVTRKK